MENRILSRSTAKAFLGCAVASLILLTHQVARAEVAEGPTILSVASDELPGQDAVALSGLEVGERLSAAAARNAIRRLWDTGQVRDARVLSRPAPGGVHVRVALTLNLRLRGLDIQGNEAMDRREIVRATGYLAGTLWDSAEELRMTEALSDAYEQRGYPNAQIEMSVAPQPRDPQAVTLTITVDEATPVTIGRIFFQGELGLTERQLIDALGLDEGDVFDRVAMTDGLDEVAILYRQQGYYQAEVDADGLTSVVSGSAEATILIPVDAGPHYTLDFVGNRWVEDQDLAEVLAIEEEPQLTRAVVDSLAERLQGHYQTLGFYHAQVDWRVFELGPGQRRIAFRVQSGPQVHVTSITFQGNVFFPDRHLRRQVEAVLEQSLGTDSLFEPISDAEVEALGLTGEGAEPWRARAEPHYVLRVTPEEVYVDRVYDEACRHIENLYYAEGYLQAVLGEPALTFSEDQRTIAVEIPVLEGPRTHIQSLTFFGNQAMSDEELFRLIGMDIEEPLNRYEVEQARRRILEEYSDRGHVYASVETLEILDEPGEWADIVLEIEEGDRVEVRDVIVRGNTDTRTSLIRDRITLRRGSVFSPSQARASEQALIELGIFATVSVELADPDVPAPFKDVVVEVAERRPQYLELRLGFSTADGPRTLFRYGYNNLFGYAFGIDLRAELSFQVFFFNTPTYERFVQDLAVIDRLERVIVGSLRLPHIPILGRILTFGIEAKHERDNDPAYAVDRNGVSFTIQGRYRFLNVRLQTGFENLFVDQVQDLPSCHVFGEPNTPYSELVPIPGENCLHETRQATELSRAPQGESWLWVTRLSVSLDLRDNPFNPSKGVFASLSAEHVHSIRPVVETIAVLDEDGREIRDEYDNILTTEVSRYSELIRFSALLSGYIPLGFLDFVLALSVRFGWVFDLTDDSWTFPDRYFYLGGNDTVRGFPEESMNAQGVAAQGGNSMLLMRGELRIPLPASFALGLFVDAGNIWREKRGLWRDFRLRVSIGAGIRFHTPVGPLALDVGVVLPRGDNEPEDWQWYPHFAIGMF